MYATYANQTKMDVVKLSQSGFKPLFIVSGSIWTKVSREGSDVQLFKWNMGKNLQNFFAVEYYDATLERNN